MINGFLNFFLFSFKKKLFCIHKNTRNQLVYRRERNVLFLSREEKKACSFFLTSTSLFLIAVPCVFFFLFASQSLKLYKSVFYWSLYLLLMLQQNNSYREKKIAEFICANLNKSHKLLLNFFAIDWKKRGNIFKSIADS